MKRKKNWWFWWFEPLWLDFKSLLNGNAWMLDQQKDPDYRPPHIPNPEAAYRRCRRPACSYPVFHLRVTQLGWGISAALKKKDRKEELKVLGLYHPPVSWYQRLTRMFR